MKLIGLTGFAQSGKDTAASFLVERGWKRLAFADKLREAALAIDPWVDTAMFGFCRLRDIVNSCGWDAAKQNSEVRRLLQKIGTEAGREIHGKDCWVDIVETQLGMADWNHVPKDPDDCFKAVVTDVRFPEEVEMVRAYHGTVVRITKPGVGPINNHKSDAAIDEIIPDATIDNDGTLEDLKRKIIGYAYDEVPA